MRRLRCSTSRSVAADPTSVRRFESGTIGTPMLSSTSIFVAGGSVMARYSPIHRKSRYAVRIPKRAFSPSMGIEMAIVDRRSVLP